MVSALDGLVEGKADCMDYSDSTPRNLLIVFGSLLLLCVLISHPRFLARLFASIPTSSDSKSSSYSRRTDYPHDGQSRAVTVAEKAVRVVGGGGLSTGWILRQAEARTHLSLPINETDDPFASPFDDLSLHTPSTPDPHLYPPPHIAPLLSHLPLSSTFLLAPFSSLPNPFRSSATLIQIYIAAAYLFFVALALIWKSDITPTTKDKGYGGDFARSGLVALTQIPLVVALGVRGNLIGLCVGKGYERLKFFHKVVGRVLFVAATLHVAFFSKSPNIGSEARAFLTKGSAQVGYGGHVLHVQL